MSGAHARGWRRRVFGFGVFLAGSHNATVLAGGVNV